MRHGQTLGWGGMSDSSRHRPHVDQGKHAGVLRYITGLNWIRRREEEASLANNDLLVVKFVPLRGTAIALW